MADAIYGGATIEATQNDMVRQLQSTMKGYQRQLFHDGVYADIDVLDKNGHIIGQLKNHRLMNLPYYSNRYTMLLDGHEYSIVSQMRTKSGVYTRKRGNDELESAFNLARGANFKLVMEPDTGCFQHRSS